MSLKETATTVLELIEAGEYQVDGQTVRFKDEQSTSLMGTRLYTPEQLAVLKPTCQLGSLSINILMKQ